MKNALALLLIACPFFATQTIAQNSGFYGKKISIEVNGAMNLALFNQIGTYGYPLYKKNGSSLTKGSDWLNGGFNTAVGIATKRDFMLGLELGWQYANIAGPQGLNEDTYYYGSDIRHEMLDIRTFSIMPTFTFAGKKGLLPVGLNHQVGVALTRTKVLDKDYAYMPDPTYSYVSQETLDMLNAENGGFVDYKQVFTGFSLAYTLKVRIPVSKSVMINYGLRYALNFTSTSYGMAGANKMTNTAVRDEISKQRFRSVISLNAGLTFAL